jgi:uncharacterized protein
LAVVDLILLVLLLTVCLGATFLTVLQLPGTWVVLAAAAAYGWYDGWTRLGWQTVAALAGIAALAEVAENLTAVWFARRGGASRRAAWWGLAGGFAGAFLLTIPIPIIGTIVGAALGCFAGAVAGELSLDRAAGASARVGVYAAVGRTLGTVLKIAATVIMAGIVVVSMVW